MGVSVTGSRMPLSSLRYGFATVCVFLGLAGYLYGPPLVPAMSDTARRECNARTGTTFRTYRLEWRTTTVRQVSAPHWVCHDLRDARRPPVDLGWWVDP